MTRPDRKGFRAAITYAALLEDDERSAVVAFLCWFYEKSPAAVIDLVTRRSAHQQQLADRAMRRPDQHDMTAEREARRLTATRASRAHALADVDQILTALRGPEGRAIRLEGAPSTAIGGEAADDVPARIAYWEAVRRLVVYVVEWRVAP